MRKLTFLTGFATGYVLGTKAGRERFDQIRGMVDQFLGKPQVQETIATVKTETDQLVGKAKDVVSEKVGGTPTTDTTTDTTAMSGTGSSGTGSTAGTSTATKATTAKTSSSSRVEPYPSGV